MIEFLGNSGDSWFQPDQVADITDTEAVFFDGRTFPLLYIHDVELRDLDAPDAGEESASDAPSS